MLKSGYSNTERLERMIETATALISMMKTAPALVRMANTTTALMGPVAAPIVFLLEYFSSSGWITSTERPHFLARRILFTNTHRSSSVKQSTEILKGGSWRTHSKDSGPFGD